MTDRLSPSDAALLELEDTETPLRAGMVAICHDPDGRVDEATLIAMVRAWLDEVPRYRQVVGGVPGHLAGPVWVDDAAFDRRAFNLVITNVPGPQEPLYVGGGRLLATYPVLPVQPGQAVSIGSTSYDGGVHYGLNVDRSAMPDVETLALCITEALAELVDAAS